jgi:hypothetical protein
MLNWGFGGERATRIELAFSAWEADVLPLNYARWCWSHYRLADVLLGEKKPTALSWLNAR